MMKIFVPDIHIYSKSPFEAQGKQSDGAFTVGIKQEQTTDIRFNFLIVN